MEVAATPQHVIELMASVFLEKDFFRGAKRIEFETSQGLRAKLSKPEMDAFLGKFYARERIGVMSRYLEQIPPHAREKDPVRQMLGEYCTIAYDLIKSQELLPEYFPK